MATEIKPPPIKVGGYTINPDSPEEAAQLREAYGPLPSEEEKLYLFVASGEPECLRALVCFDSMEAVAEYVRQCPEEWKHQIIEGWDLGIWSWKTQAPGINWAPPKIVSVVST